MSEEQKENLVEDENPSAAEKETIALKKIGADVGTETITKVDLRETPTEETTEEPLNEEVAEEEKKEESQTETQESEESNQVTLEEIIEDEESEEVQEEEKPAEKEITKEEVIKEAATTPEIELPENIQKVVDFMNETGGTLEDYVKINQDYSKIEDSSLLYEYYTQTKSHL